MWRNPFEAEQAPLLPLANGPSTGGALFGRVAKTNYASKLAPALNSSLRHTIFYFPRLLPCLAPLKLVAVCGWTLQNGLFSDSNTPTAGRVNACMAASTTPPPPAALPHAGRRLTHLVLPQAHRLDDDGIVPGHLAEEHNFVGVPRYAAQHSPRRTASHERAAGEHEDETRTGRGVLH